MLQFIEKNLIIVSNEAKLHRYTNQSNSSAFQVFSNLQEKIGCTYLIYMYENLLNNEKFIYSSNWEWQDLLIGNKLINHCPIFLAAFRFLEKRKSGHMFIPWYLSPPTNADERNVWGLRSEFNIANGIGYAAKGFGIRESIAFGGDAKDKSFYKNFIISQKIFYKTLQEMRIAILMRNYLRKKTLLNS